MITTPGCVTNSTVRWAAFLAALCLTSTLQAAPTGVDWQWANPTPQGNAFNGIGYSSTAGKVVAVGELGYITSSSDSGSTWTAQTSGTAARLNAILPGDGGISYVVGDNGLILSTNATAWTVNTSSTTESLNGVAASSSLYVVVGNNGTILTNDGSTTSWTAQTAPASSGNLMAVTWNPAGLFVAVSDSGVILASPDGASWTKENFLAGGFIAPSGFAAVTWDSNNAQFVAVGLSGLIETSASGASWVQQTSGTTASLTGVVASSTQLVVVGRYAVLTSANGTAWTVQSAGNSLDLHGVASDGSQFFAAGIGGRILNSSDGAVSWSLQQPASNLTAGFSNDRINDVAWSGSQFLVVGDLYDGSGNTATFTSADGISWSAHSYTSAPTTAVIWDGAGYVGIDATNAYTSTDGITWTANTVAAGINLNGITWDGAQYFVVGLNGIIYTSSDAVSWTISSSGVMNNFNAISGNGSVTVAVGDGGVLRTSSDGGTSWTSPSIPALGTSSLFDVLWSGTKFIAVGNGGLILTSSDGTTWTSQTSGVSTRLRGVAWSSKQFIAVGSPGVVITSPDGTTWTNQTSGTANDLTSVAGTSTRLIATGWNGTILTSSGSSSGGGGGSLNPYLLIFLLLLSMAFLHRRRANGYAALI